MYTRIKEILKSIIPQKVLFHYEPFFRFIVYQYYKGTYFECTICNKTLRKFIRLEKGDQLCPNCGSLSRTRRLWQLLEKEFIQSDIKILDFSPSRSIYRVLKKRSDLTYVSTDLSNNFLSDFKYDITAIDVDDQSFDLIICYHILEHVEADLKAMSELHRVLKMGGKCIVQTPFKSGDIYEDYSIKTEEERQKHFGQKDHVRIYSAAALTERLESCGFIVTVRNYPRQQENKYGFNANETILICSR